MIAGVLLAAAMSTLVPATHAAGAETITRRGYVDGPYGQIHYHSAMPACGTGSRTPVVLFHQTPQSSNQFLKLTAALGTDRIAIAFDTPGYGSSDAPPRPASMQEYTAAMAIALERLGYGPHGKGPVDVFGFHTGAFIASELAVSRPDLVRRVGLGSVGYRPSAQDLADSYQQYVASRDAPIADYAAHIARRWKMAVTDRPADVPLEEGALFFFDMTRPLNRYWWAWHGVFTYDARAQLPKIRQPTLLIAVDDNELEYTRATRHDLLPDARYVELLELGPGNPTGKPAFVKALRDWYDAP
ncbi:MAG: hypothetical protein AMXMBFR37_10030 [Steroidobacteraceae bacterium]